MLSIRIENTDDAAVLRCVGRIVAGDPIHALQDAVMCQVGRRIVVLDLAEVDAVDDWVGKLYLSQDAGLRCRYGVQVNERVNERVGELVDVTKLDSVFETWCQRIWR